VRDALEACGFPPCPAGYIAANPAWCQPLGSWKHTFSSWVANPDAEAVLRALILFDFRPLRAKATELQLPSDAQRATIQRRARPREIVIIVSWPDTISLPFYRWAHTYRTEVRAPL
jgi:CBS domain-containing protein